MTNSGLAIANETFRAAYAEARDAAARQVPIMVVLGDDLLLRFRDQRKVWCFTPPGFHDVKAGAHLLVAVLSLLSLDAAGKGPGAERRARLERLSRALPSPSEEATRRESASCLRRATSLARDLLDWALRDGQVSREALADQAQRARPVILELTEEAARSRLSSLHACVEGALRVLDAEALGNLRVVVAGDHQARARSLAMQYFQKRLPDRAGHEKAVIYGESVTTEEEAIALVGTCRVDRTIANVIFGDPEKLQQDVLGDATKAQLDGMELTSIE